MNHTDPRIRHMEYQRYKRRVHENHGNPIRVPVSRAMRVIDEMRTDGLSLKEIARAANLVYTTVWRISAGLTAYTLPETVEALETASFNRTRALMPEQWITATVTMRKLQALACEGWTMAELDRQRGLPIPSNTMSAILSGSRKFVEAGTATTVDDLFRRLIFTPPPAATPWMAARVRDQKRKASDMRWPSIWAWDDIEDLKEKPLPRKQWKRDSRDRRIA